MARTRRDQQPGYMERWDEFEARQARAEKDTPRSRAPRDPVAPLERVPLEAVPYVELHAHSHYSLLEGASSPDELVRTAVEQGHAALALTDHDGLFGAMEFARAAREAGLRPISGLELTVSEPAAEGDEDAEGGVVRSAPHAVGGDAAGLRQPLPPLQLRLRPARDGAARAEGAAARPGAAARRSGAARGRADRADRLPRGPHPPPRAGGTTQRGGGGPRSPHWLVRGGPGLRRAAGQRRARRPPAQRGAGRPRGAGGRGRGRHRQRPLPRTRAAPAAGRAGRDPPQRQPRRVPRRAPAERRVLAAQPRGTGRALRALSPAGGGEHGADRAPLPLRPDRRPRLPAALAPAGRGRHAAAGAWSGSAASGWGSATARRTSAPGPRRSWPRSCG